jgi:hypothetical protein
VTPLCFFFSYPEKDELSAIYNLYVSHILSQSLSKHPVWKLANKVSTLASSMISIYEEVKATFTPMNHNHYLFTPRDLTRWCLGLFRYNLNADSQTADHVLHVSITYLWCDVLLCSCINLECWLTFSVLQFLILMNSKSSFFQPSFVFCK